MARSIIFAAAMFLSSCSTAFASGTSPDVYGRVSYLEGELLRLGSEGEAPTPLQLNELVRAGDRLETGPGSFVEIELPSATFFRLSASTRASLEPGDGEPELSVAQGAVIVSRAEDGPETSISSATVRVTTLPEAMVRIDLDPFVPALDVRVLRSSVKVEREDDWQMLSAPHSRHYKRGRVIDDRKLEEDAFDRWNEAREKVVRGYAPPAEIAGRYQGLYDLEGQGQWVLIEGQWYWSPFVSEDWAPYADGSWGWYPIGWTWIPHARWGYVTHHYGRWIFFASRGWCWSPDPVWSPAWVVWSAHDDYVAWAPCDRYGRAVIVTGARRRVWRSATATYFARDYAKPRGKVGVRFEPREIAPERAVAVKNPVRPERKPDRAVPLRETVDLGSIRSRDRTEDVPVRAPPRPSEAARPRDERPIEREQYRPAPRAEQPPPIRSAPPIRSEPPPRVAVPSPTPRANPPPPRSNPPPAVRAAPPAAAWRPPTAAIKAAPPPAIKTVPPPVKAAPAPAKPTPPPVKAAPQQTWKPKEAKKTK